MIGALRARAIAIPRTYVVVFCVAAACGGAWALLMPSFQAPDETAHFAYVQYVAETGRMPDGGSRPQFSSEQSAAMLGYGTQRLIGRGNVRVPDTDPLGAVRQADVRARDDGGGATSASPQPPLYYLVAAVPYRIFASADLATQLLAIRLLSVLMFAATAVLAAMLAAELLGREGRRPWVALVAGLAIALAPMMTSLAGGVTPDNLMDLLAVAMLLALVRALRAPTVGRLALVGALAGAGAITKLTFAGLIPGVAVGCLVAAWRLGRRDGTARGIGGFGVALAAGLALPVAYAIWTVAQGRGLLPVGVSTAVLPEELRPAASTREMLSYTWQLFLPRLPFLTDEIAGFGPSSVWLTRFVGQYGWLDYGATAWMIDIARVVVAVLLAGIVAAVVPRWRLLRAHLTELLIFALVAIGLGVLLGRSGYDYRRVTGFDFEQARYLFPLAGLYASAVALACLGVGRRWAPVAAAFLVGVFALHQVSGILLTLARYYG